MKKRLILGLAASILCLSACQRAPEVPDTPDNPDSPDTPDTPDNPEVSLENSVVIHYYRYDEKYDNWALWLWENGKDGKEYTFNSSDSYGAIASYPLTTWSDALITNGLGFIVKSKGSWDSKDVEADRFIDFSSLTKDDKNSYHIYLKTQDANIYTDANDVAKQDLEVCKFLDANRIFFVPTSEIKAYQVLVDGEAIISSEVTSKELSFTVNLDEKFTWDITKKYEVKATFANDESITKEVDYSPLYKSVAFNDKYTYDGELGAIYNKDKTIFRVWSPASSSITLNIYDNGTPTSVNATLGSDNKESTIPMIKNEKGVFEAEVSGDLEGKYYTYSVTNSSYKNKEIVDPYAYSTGVNGLRGMIVDFAKTNPEGWNDISPLPYDRKELVVYETHIADLTSSATWSSDPNNESLKHTFLGAKKEGTTYVKDGATYTTGFDHIKELGVNAVQLLPIFDQANDETNMSFNWGYNPLNYNTLEGGYSSDPYDGYARIKEFKELVKAYNKAGINIIMDVVYNHVNSAIGSNFDVLMPKYFYRYSGNKLSNGSGCGNETASELPMFRKFMIDSTEFWAKEYKLGGFRFDLMGLHDIQTMNELDANLKTFNENITVYGEPWTGGSTPLSSREQAVQANATKFEGYGQFNDKLRDSLIKGGLADKSEKGWVNRADSKLTRSEMSALTNGVKGLTVASTGSVLAGPDKSVSYVTCHDNYTLIDRMEAADEGNPNNKKSAVLANSVALTSQGTCFMLAGEEFLRSKGGNSNSYDASYEVNELDYSLKATNSSVFDYYKKLVNLKKSFAGLHLDEENAKAIDVIESDDGNQIRYEITANGETYLFIHNNGYKAETLGSIDVSGYEVYLDTNVEESKTNATLKGSALMPYETLILKK